jgi:hypothetical protein
MLPCWYAGWILVKPIKPQPIGLSHLMSGLNHLIPYSKIGIRT